jgi:hypothetical protein
VGYKIKELLQDLSTLTEFEPDDWRMSYEDKEYPWSVDEFNKLVPLSPRDYRARKEEDLNPLRAAAGLDPKSTGEVAPDLQGLQSAAGII